MTARPTSLKSPALPVNREPNCTCNFRGSDWRVVNEKIANLLRAGIMTLVKRAKEGVDSVGKDIWRCVTVKHWRWRIVCFHVPKFTMRTLSGSRDRGALYQDMGSENLRHIRNLSSKSFNVFSICLRVGYKDMQAIIISLWRCLRGQFYDSVRIFGPF